MSTRSDGRGTAAAALFIATVALVADTGEGVQRNTVLGVNTAVPSAGAAISPLVGLPVAALAYRVLPEPPGERETRTVAYLRRAVSALSFQEASALVVLLPSR